jgi:cytochrome c2
MMPRFVGTNGFAYHGLNRSHACLAAVAAALGLFVASSHAQAPGIILGPQAAAAPALDIGQLLLGELNCVACHQADAGVRARLTSRPPPLLADAGLRITPQYLRAFVADPQSEKPGTTMPELLHGMSREEKAETVEALVHFLLSLNAAPAPAAVGADPFKIQQGRLLYHQIGCVACHAPQESAAALRSPSDPEHAQTTKLETDELAGLKLASVPLGDLAKKTTVEPLAKFLMDPLSVRPSGRMPSLGLNEGEATALAMYLLREQALGPSAGRTPQKLRGLSYQYFEGDFSDTKSIERSKPKASGLIDHFALSARKRTDNIGFRFTGFVTAPADGDYTFYTVSDDGSQLYLAGTLVVNNDGTHATTEKKGSIRLKAGEHPIKVLWFNGGGEMFLKVSYEGPGLNKQEIPASALSTDQGLPMVPLGEEKVAVDPAKAKHGRELFGPLGCAACHSIGQQSSPASTLAAKPLADLDAAASDGCLGSNVKSGVPRFHLSGPQRDALRAALAARASLAQPLDAKAELARTMAALNCCACHSRDGGGGPVAGRAEYFTTVGEADLGDEGRLAPDLTRVGDKLRPDWLRTFLLSKGSVRPYMATRMPQFGQANVGRLAAAFEKADSSRAELAAAPESSEANYGRKLVGTSGMGCITCHTFAGHKSLGIPAMDLTVMTRRLKKDWFHRYLLDPASLRPGTRMPGFWPEGKSARQDILGGDTDRQINAIWAYLSKGTEVGLPEGLIRGRIELVASNEAVIYRNFIDGSGPRAIGVGYPEKANLSFDANDLRLALIWQGPFIDAAKHRDGRGAGFVPPLGYNVVKMPAGAPFAMLDNPGAAWPLAGGKKAGYQMRGYRLDAKRRPTFLYSYQRVQIEDQPVAVPGELDPGLRRTLTFHADQPVETLWFRAWAGAKIKPQGGGYLADGKVKLQFTLSGGAKPLLRQSGGHSEILVPVTFSGKEASIVEDINW